MMTDAQEPISISNKKISHTKSTYINYKFIQICHPNQLCVPVKLPNNLKQQFQ
jgi:hypothetical protein